MKLYIILVALLGVLLLATGCSDDANNYNQTMVDPDNATYWDSTCDRINKDEFLICYGFVTNKYKKYNDSNIIYYSIAILKEIDGGDSHLELYQIKLQKSDFDQVDKNVLLNKPYNVDSVNGKIDLLENVLPSKTSISFQQLLEKYREFPKGEESSQP